MRERPLEVAPHAPAIQADFRASGDRLQDQDQQQKRIDLIRKCVNSILQSPHRRKFKEELLQCQRKDTEVNERTAELHSKQGDIGTTELVVIDETTQCDECKEHKAKGKSFYTRGVILEALSAEKTHTLKEATAQLMSRLTSLQWQIRT